MSDPGTLEYERGYCLQCSIDCDHPDWPCEHAVPGPTDEEVLRKDGQPEIFTEE